jgi:hypothetical protein
MRWQWGAAGEFCTCITLIKFSDVPQSTSAETGLGERSGMDTVMMNDDGEREEMVVHKCTESSDEETLVMWGSSGVMLAPPEIVKVAWATGLCNVDVVVVLLEVAGVVAGVTGVCGEPWWWGQLSTAWLLCAQ